MVEQFELNFNLKLKLLQIKTVEIPITFQQNVMRVEFKCDLNAVLM